MRVFTSGIAALGLVVAGCHAPPPPPIASAPLVIEPMPKSPLPTLPPPPPVSGAGPVGASGTCGHARVGDLAPPLTAMTSDGRAVAAKDRVTIIYFWATWCEPCKKAFAGYQSLWKARRGQGFQIYAISVDDDEKDVAPYAKQHGLGFPVGWDRGHADAECWRVQSMASAYIVDREGRIRFVHDAYRDGEMALIEQEVASLL